MSKLLNQIKAIDAAIAQVRTQGFARPTPLQNEPRSERCAKARDATKASQPMRSRPVSNNLVKQN